MPEGHTIHRIARDHNAWFAGQQLSVSSPQGRFAGGAERIDGLTLSNVSAIGKHLFYNWADGTLTHVHLGLYGKFRIHKLPVPEPRGAVRMRAIGTERAFDLNGPTCCENVDRSELSSIVDRLGGDPLRSDANIEIVRSRVQKSRAPIGILLLNQSVIAGVGNVYRAEILFLLGIHPETPGTALDHRQFKKLWHLTVELLKIGVKYNRIITVDRNSVGKPLSRLTATERLNIYKKKHCPRCGNGVRSWELAARKMFACEQCQKPPSLR